MELIHKVKTIVLKVISFTNPAVFQVNLYKLWKLWKTSDSQTILCYIRGSSNDYAKWVKQYDTLDNSQKNMMRKRYMSLSAPPIIKIIITLDADRIPQLEQTLHSLALQIHQKWTLEIVLEDADRRVKVEGILASCLGQDWQAQSKLTILSPKKDGMVSRIPVDNGAGWIAHIQAGDSLPESALFLVAMAANTHLQAKMIYSDEDCKDENDQRYAPFFKGDLDCLRILAQNMVGQLCVYHNDLIREFGGFPVGNRDIDHWDLVLQALRYIDRQQVVHIPKILYHRQDKKVSLSQTIHISDKDAPTAQDMIKMHLKDTGNMASVVATPENAALNRVRFSAPEPAPLVSIIIPTRDNAIILKACLSSILSKTNYPNYEIIVIDNGSQDQTTFDLFKRMKKEGVRIIKDAAPFNFSALNNKGAQQAKGDLLCLMNNDIEVIAKDWLDELASFATQPDIGCVGARLWYPDGRLQHAGIVFGIGQVAGHPHRFLDRNQPGYFGRAFLHQEVSAVTAACLLVRRSIYERVGGLDEALGVSYNDVDFCLKVRDAGYRNIWTPYAELYHHESISRGYEDTIEKQKRIFHELDIMKKRWGKKLDYDPYYNPNLTLLSEDYSLAWPPRQSAP